MNSNIAKFLYRGTAYTAAISIVFFLFAKALSLSELQLSFTRYLTILAFGMIVSAAEFIFILDKIPKALQYFIHYFVLAITFFIVFLTIRNSGGEFEFSASTIFASLVIFTCFYAIIFGAVLITKKILANQKNKKDASKKKMPSYKSRFK